MATLAPLSRPLLLLLSVALLVGVANVGSGWLDPLHTLPQTRFTEGQFINLALGARELPFPRHTDLLGAPRGAGFAPLLWPMLWVARVVGPVLALNLCFTLLPVFNAVSGWVLGRALGLQDWASAALGGLLCWNAWVMNTLANGQLEQVPIGGAALLWAAVHVAQRDGRARLLLPGVVTLAVGLGAPNVALAGLIGVAMQAVVALWRGPRARAVIWLVGVGAAGLLVNAYQAPQFSGGAHVFAPRGTFVTHQSAAMVPGIFDAATLGALLLPPALPSIASGGVVHCAYLGWVGLVAALGAGKPGRFWVGIAAVLVIFALGDQVRIGSVIVPLPAALLGMVSSAVAQSGNQYRLVLGAVAALSVAAAWTVRGPRSAVLLVGLAWIELALVRNRGVPLPNEPWVPHASSVALRGGEGTVLDLPLANPQCPEMAWHDAVQAVWTERPIPLVLAFDYRAWGTAVDMGRKLERAFTLTDCVDTVPSRLTRLGIRAVVVHHDQTCPLHPQVVPCLEALYGPPQRGPESDWWVLP